MAHKTRKKKYPRRCCAKCDTMHRTYASAQRHKAEMGGSASRPKRRKARKRNTGFAAMSKKRRVAAARKGGRASARARGY